MKSIKLIYDFNTASNLEIYLPNKLDWFRVTSKDFRSFSGARKIDDNPYYGPIYAYGTNNQVTPDTPTHSIIAHNWVSLKREFEI